MRKLIRTLSNFVVVVLLVTILSCNSGNIGINSYAEDRAQIENLQARYMFAMNSFDLDTYVSTFTEDGILDIVTLQAQGRNEIRKTMEASKSAFVPSSAGSFPATSRHNITNILLKIDGDKAVGRSYWFHYGNDNPERKPVIDSYGHYEDEMVKVNGEWLFSKRVIYNETGADWCAPPGNLGW